MSQVFIAFAEPDAPCALQLTGELEARGFATWRPPQQAGTAGPTNARAVEQGVIGSVALLVVWSAHAATSEWVEREILFAQRLRKPVFVVQVDPTDLPITLINTIPIFSTSPCADAVDQLLPQLLAATNPALGALAMKLVHGQISERRNGLKGAAELLKTGQHQEEVLALLDYVAHNDMIKSLRDLAAQMSREANAAARAAQDKAFFTAEQARHIVGAKCSKGHITYFDKRRVCPPSGTFLRTLVERGGAKLDELYLTCGDCGEEMVIRVDCEGYK